MFLDPGVVVLARHEAERGRVDAVAFVGGRGAVGKDMAEVGAVHLHVDLGADHAVAGVGVLADEGGFDGFSETRPAGAAVEFVFAVEERGVAADGEIDAVFLVIMVFVLERRFGALFAGDLELEGREEFLPLGVGFFGRRPSTYR